VIPPLGLPRWLTPALILGAVVAYAVWHFAFAPGQPVAAKLATVLSAAGRENAVCVKVGLIAVAGGRSDLYGCQWSTATDGAGMAIGTTRRCDVWEDGAAFDVTTTARAIFRAQNTTSPC
jgi:hypothetical protein